MNFREIRTKFIDFFKERNHEVVASSPLIPRDDPSLLFTNAGMVQFKGLYLGTEKRSYSRAVTSQKCVRAGGKHNDLENVGYTGRHHTFFEMLGNFSFGDYFKVEAIHWAWELLTDGYKLPPDKLWASVYKDDDEAYEIWEKQIGIPPERIVRLGEEDNFWVMGDTGPCGPCSEILIDQGESVGCGRPECAPGCECDRYLEIWNLVFTQFDRDPSGKLTPLASPNIDTGMGLERIAAVVQGVTSNYDTDLFRDIISFTEDIAEKRYGDNEKQDVSFRVIADHSRAAAFLVCDGVLPSNEGRGYVLRRIIRRALRFGMVLGIRDPFLHRVAGRVIDIMGADYPDLLSSRGFIEGITLNEEKRFAATLYHGMKILQDSIEEVKEKKETTIPGGVVFKLYDTYGLSPDIVRDVAREETLEVDLEGFDRAMARQRTMSQESWKGSGEEEIPDVYRALNNRGVKTEFVGHESLAAASKIAALLKDGQEVPSAKAGERIEVVLDRTPFYGEAGGQVGDKGWLAGDGMRVKVTNTLKFGDNLIVHQGEVDQGALDLPAGLQDSLEKGFVRTYFKIEGRAKNLLALSNHDPLLVSAEAGKSRLFQFASSADLDWNDLPLNVAYLPLVQGVVKEAVGRTGPSIPAGLKAGEPQREEGSFSQIEGPRGGPGIVQSRHASGEMRRGVNVPHEESDLAKIGEDELKKKFGPVNVKVIGYQEGGLKDLQGGRKELWPALLVFLLALLSLEMFLANRLTPFKRSEVSSQREESI